MNYSTISQFELINLKNIPFSDERHQVLRTKETKVLTVGEICEKIPNFQQFKEILMTLGENTPIISLFWWEGAVVLGLPKIYLDENKTIRLFDVEHQAINIPLEFISYKTDLIRQGENRVVIGEQRVKVGNSALVVPVGLNDNYTKMLKERDRQGESLENYLQQGKGVISVHLLKYYPRPIKSSASFEVGEQYRILKNLGNDPRYDRPRYQLQPLRGEQEVGKPIEVLANYSLQKHWENYGNRPCTVVEKSQKERGWSLKFALSDFVEAN